MSDNHSIHVLSRAVIIYNNYILLAYDPRINPNHYYEPGKKFYYLPGGHIEFKESAPIAVLREIKEESGFNAIIERYLGSLEHIWSFPGDEVCCHTHEINFIFKLHIPELTNNIVITKKEEHVAFKWFLLSELENIDFRPKELKKLIPEWLLKENNTWHSKVY